MHLHSKQVPGDEREVGAPGATFIHVVAPAASMLCGDETCHKAAGTSSGLGCQDQPQSLDESNILPTGGYAPSEHQPLFTSNRHKFATHRHHHRVVMTLPTGTIPDPNNQLRPALEGI